MKKLKASKITKQVAAGREFKGQAFLSKPSEIVFKVSQCSVCFAAGLYSS